MRNLRTPEVLFLCGRALTFFCLSIGYTPIVPDGREFAMTVVYLDMLFAVNFIANYLLLLGAGRIAGAMLKRWRIALGAAVGALYAAALFLPGCAWLGAWPYKLASGFLMPVAAYWGERRLVRVTVCFFGASVALAGAILAIEMLGGTALSLQNGVLYSSFDLRLLLLVFVACYFAMSLFFRRVGESARRDVVPMVIDISGQRVQLSALIDSGHSLSDPVSNRPVVVAEGGMFSALLPAGADPSDPVEGVRICREAGMSGVRLIPYRAVGVECGLLMSLRADAVTVGGREAGALLIALSPTPVDSANGYQALIGGF